MKKKQKTITPRVILFKQPDSLYTQRQRTLTGAISDANGVDKIFISYHKTNLYFM
jgi:hypothetical protein